MANRRSSVAALLAEVRACRLCEDVLEPRPVLQLDARARILIAGQAPGRRVHASGVPFDDPSGDRLRDWLGVTRDEFYDATRFAVLPMGFCYPGRGSSGDLPPRPECAEAWRSRLLGELKALEWTFVIGAHAVAWHLGGDGADLTSVVRAWREHRARRATPLPHPSPRNNPWLARNPWFEAEVLPEVRRVVRKALS